MGLEALLQVAHGGAEFSQRHLEVHLRSLGVVGTPVLVVLLVRMFRRFPTVRPLAIIHSPTLPGSEPLEVCPSTAGDTTPTWSRQGAPVEPRSTVGQDV